MKSYKSLQKMLIVLVFASTVLMGFDRGYQSPKNIGTSPKVYATGIQAGPTAALLTPVLSQVTSASPAPTFRVIKLTFVVKHGNYATVVINTKPGSTCILRYRSPRGRFVRKGPFNKADLANKKGMCRWKWKIGRGSVLGSGEVIISVNGVEKTYPIIVK